MIMLNDLLKQRPDVVRGWLQAELEAQRFLADPGQRRRGRQDGAGADRGDAAEGAVERPLRRWRR